MRRGNPDKGDSKSQGPEDEDEFDKLKELVENHLRLLITFHRLIASLGRNSYSKLYVAFFCSELQSLSS